MKRFRSSHTNASPRSPQSATCPPPGIEPRAASSAPVTTAIVAVVTKKTLGRRSRSALGSDVSAPAPAPAAADACCAGCNALVSADAAQHARKAHPGGRGVVLDAPEHAVQAAVRAQQHSCAPRQHVASRCVQLRGSAPKFSADEAPADACVAAAQANVRRQCDGGAASRKPRAMRIAYALPCSPARCDAAARVSAGDAVQRAAQACDMCRRAGSTRSRFSAARLWLQRRPW